MYNRVQGRGSWSGADKGQASGPSYWSKIRHFWSKMTLSKKEE